MKKCCLTFAALLCTVTAWADCDKTTTDYDVVYCGAKIISKPTKS